MASKIKIATTKGFTLIELLVVISIIGILSTLAVVSLNNARLKARDTKRVSDIKQIQTALELYASDKFGYPAVDAAGLVLGSADGSTLSKTAGFSATASGTLYMGNVPSNALPGGVDYVYKSWSNSGATSSCTSGTCIWYTINFELEEQTGGLAQGARVANPTGID